MDEEKPPPACEDACLLPNQPTPALMIPPEHMEKIQLLLQNISTLASEF
jgi:hypothetical protein